MCFLDVFLLFLSEKHRVRWYRHIYWVLALLVYRYIHAIHCLSSCLIPMAIYWGADDGVPLRLLFGGFLGSDLSNMLIDPTHSMRFLTVTSANISLSPKGISRSGGNDFNTAWMMFFLYMYITAFALLIVLVDPRRQDVLYHSLSCKIDGFPLTP